MAAMLNISAAMRPDLSDLTALADQLHTQLTHGDFAGRGPVELGPGAHFPDAALAARIVLADVEHCRWLD